MQGNRRVTRKILCFSITTSSVVNDNIDQSVFPNNTERIAETMQASDIDIPISKCPSVEGTAFACNCLISFQSVARAARLIQKKVHNLIIDVLESHDVLRVAKDKL